MAKIESEKIMGLDYSGTAAIGYFYPLDSNTLAKLEKNLGQAGYDEDELRSYEVGVDENALRAQRVIEQAGLQDAIEFMPITDQMGNGYKEHVGFVLKGLTKTWNGKYDQGVLLNEALSFDIDVLSRVTKFISEVIELDPVPLTLFVANIVY